MDKLTNLKAESCERANKAKAKRLLGNEGSSKAPKEKLRPYKKGGLVKDCK